MPELAEVETVRRGLAERVVGRRIERVEVGRERSVRRTSAEAVIAGLTGTTMIAAERRGKYLICPLDSGDAVMIHLRMSGQLRVASSLSTRPAHTHVVMGFVDDAEELRFIDPRTFGEVVVFDPDRAAEQVPELERLGIDPVIDPFDARTLAAAIAGTTRSIKTVLMDQHCIAGLGNIYSDEVLHRAGLRFDRPADRLRGREIERLATAIVDTLAEAIAAGGSTLDDAQYVDLLGRPGGFQDQHRVYGLEGRTCGSCGRGTIARVKVGGRSSFFCPRCQK